MPEDFEWQVVVHRGSSYLSSNVELKVVLRDAEAFGTKNLSDEWQKRTLKAVPVGTASD